VNGEMYDRTSEALTCMHIEVKFWCYSFDTLFVSLRDI